MVITSIKKGDYIVLLDERGKNYNSLEFSNFLQGNMINGIKNLTFIIGGAYGVDNQLKDLAKNKIALSNMTFSHDMARLFFVEQLYRSLTIINNIPYHNK